MDWVFKASSWWDDDFDFMMEKNQVMDVYSSCGVLGDGKWDEQKLSGSSKRQRIEQQVSCLVDGCMADLSSCRDYHRRHRVCVTHSKTPVVAIGGKDQRFCQQCSRFHSLGEFDEEKRSCRKRLDGHNRRRRKPRTRTRTRTRTESMYFNYGSFLTNHQGTKVVQFGGSPSTFSSWPNNQPVYLTFEQNTPPDSYARFCSAREKRFPFLLEQQVVDTNASAAYLVGECTPKGALSLLSKHTMHHTPEPSPSNFGSYTQKTRWW